MSNFPKSLLIESHKKAGEGSETSAFPKPKKGSVLKRLAKFQRRRLRRSQSK
jgi:hypothetical protein